MNVSYIFILLERVGLGFGDERYTVHRYTQSTHSHREFHARENRVRNQRKVRSSSDKSLIYNKTRKVCAASVPIYI